ncbi:MAG: dihydrofolate reductase family protein [Dehalococcoidales bacterium]|nr:dihydrofolate reductase family protein [Dehalococcoidales bacterium]
MADKLLSLATSKLDIDTLYDDLTFPDGKDGLPYVVLNMVATVDGKATIGGRSFPLGSKVDHVLMRKIRAAADMVLIGAGTLRAENVDFRMPDHLQEKRLARGLTGVPLAAVLSPSADLPLDRTFFTSKQFTAIVLCTEQADPRKVKELSSRVQVLSVGKAKVELRTMLSVLLADFGVKRLVVEGGPTLNFSLIEAGLADELFLTICPKIVGGHETSIVQGTGFSPDRVPLLRLVSAHACDNELFLRYAV